MSLRLRIAALLSLTPLLILSGSIACYRSGGGSCTFEPDPYPTYTPHPTPQIVAGPDGGLLYVLLGRSDPAESAIEVRQVSSMEALRTMTLGTGEATALAFAPAGELHVADASRGGLRVMDTDGFEYEFLPVEGLASDLAHSPATGWTFVASTAGVLARSGFVSSQALTFEDGDKPAAVATWDWYIEHDDGQVETQTSLAVATKNPVTGAAVYFYEWFEGSGYDVAFRIPLASGDCPPRPDDLVFTSDELLLVGDTFCHRAYALSVEGSVSTIAVGSSGLGMSVATHNRVAYSPDRDARVLVSGDQLFEIDASMSVTARDGFPRAAALTSSIGGQTLWVGSASVTTSLAPIVRRIDTEEQLSGYEVGDPGWGIRDLHYADRPPYFQMGDAIVVTRGERTQRQIPASDPDGDDVVVDAVSLPRGAKFEDATRTLTWDVPCGADESGGSSTGNDILRFTATAGRLRVPLRVDAELLGSCPKDKGCSCSLAPDGRSRSLDALLFAGAIAFVLRRRSNLRSS